MESEILQQIEILLGSIGVILGIFFAVYLLINCKRLPKANLFLAIYLLTFSLRIGKSVFHYFYTIDGQIRNFFLTILFCVGPSIWLYVKYTIKYKALLKKVDYLHYAIFLVLLPICWFIPNNGPENYSLIFALFYNSITIHIFIYCFFSMVWFIRNRSLERSKHHKVKQVWLSYFLGSNLLFVLFYFLISEGIFPFYIGLSFFFSALIIFYSLRALNNPILFRVQVEKYEKSTLGSKEAMQIVQLIRYQFSKRRLYLNPELSLALLSEEVNVSAKELSQAINQIEKVNYSQFILEYRIEEAKRLLKSESHHNLTIASIAYDSGFNSISSFNTAFKKITGLTPLAFQKNK
ncbi:helix-turn-helix domain-containing protein [Croceitalea rosinachiae]|uniref:Helix-turn-helix domain-containing protein n=1 Tax=Croceitalea rosinachiae TaxID=3075596 RepID=A0ABU3AB44_9FLAO|nr:helix-turn-helix domain-containing protein [Croceitalea sp. F388]MDT0607404.1 helix-turn-helix domain-containing protein [Croceitalea sp. F388]